jgi:hypothetical protein
MHDTKSFFFTGGTFVLILPEDEVSIDGDLKFYEDKKTDSGTTLNRFFCGTCGW